jgi:hypothetical protein
MNLEWMRLLASMTFRRLDDFFANCTVPGHSGLDLEHQPEFTLASPWLVAAKDRNQNS